MLYLPVPPVVPECVQTAGKQRLCCYAWALSCLPGCVHGKGLDKALRQFCHCGISAAWSWLVPYIMERVWQLYKLQWVYAGAGLLILLLVWAAGNRASAPSCPYHSRSIHPAVGICEADLVFFVASMFYQSMEFKTIFLTTAVAGAHVLVLVLSKDLGKRPDFLCHLPADAVCCHRKLGVSDNGKALGTGAALAAYQLFDHVAAGWRPEQSVGRYREQGIPDYPVLFAIGTGGWFGMGLCQGMPGKIPVVEKDFIFSAVSEEMGAIFAICVLLICLGCFIQFMMIAARMQAVFYKLIAFGLGVEYIVQVFLTVGG